MNRFSADLRSDHADGLTSTIPHVSSGLPRSNTEVDHARTCFCRALRAQEGASRAPAAHYAVKGMSHCLVVLESKRFLAMVVVAASMI